MNSKNYIEEEIKDIKALFNLDEILSFQLNNDIQIIRGEDYQYMCYINKEVYDISLTPMGALVYGIRKFKEK